MVFGHSARVGNATSGSGFSGQAARVEAGADDRKCLVIAGITRRRGWRRFLLRGMPGFAAVALALGRWYGRCRWNRRSTKNLRGTGCCFDLRLVVSRGGGLRSICCGLWHGLIVVGISDMGLVMSVPRWWCSGANSGIML